MNLHDELLSFMVELHPCSSPKLQELNHKEIALWKEIQAQVGVEKTERLQDVLAERADLIDLHRFRLCARLIWELLR